MAKRRRNVRKPGERPGSSRKTSRRPGKSKSLKERLLTTGIWGAAIINVTLIVSLLSNFFAGPHETTQQVEFKAITEPITVEVLNGCGVPGLANEVTQYLRDQEFKFDVVNVGNYQGGFNLERTFVLDRAALNQIYANKVAEVLGVAQEQIAPQVNDSLQLKVTVIVGKDYRNLNVFKNKQN
jgi:hypothetical protein